MPLHACNGSDRHVYKPLFVGVSLLASLLKAHCPRAVGFLKEKVRIFHWFENLHQPLGTSMSFVCKQHKLLSADRRPSEVHTEVNGVVNQIRACPICTGGDSEMKLKFFCVPGARACGLMEGRLFFLATVSFFSLSS